MSRTGDQADGSECESSDLEQLLEAALGAEVDDDGDNGDFVPVSFATVSASDGGDRPLDLWPFRTNKRTGAESSHQARGEGRTREGSPECRAGSPDEFAAASPERKRPRVLERIVSLDAWVPQPKGRQLEHTPSLSDWKRRSPPVEVQFRVPKPSGEGSNPATPRFPGAAGTSAAAHSHPMSPFSRQLRSCQLEHLPHAVLFRVMCCLSAETLSIVCQTSKSLRSFAADNTLWRRMYLGRWRTSDPKQLGSHRMRGATTWQGYYRDRDAKEVHEALRKMPESMREACRCMHAALRKTTIPLGSQSAADDLVLADAAEADKVVEWRRNHGMPDTVAFHECPRAGKTIQSCKYIRIGEALVCERSGWAHICDDACSERIIAKSSGMMTCPISGRCFETLMNEAEERAARGGCGEINDDDHYYEKGSLGRSFSAGYSCNDEKDLQRFCGVRLS